jgi:hypothetical protein
VSSLTELRDGTVKPPSADRSAEIAGEATIAPPPRAAPRRSSANRRLGLALAVVVLAMLVMTVAAAVAIHVAGNPQFNF